MNRLERMCRDYAVEDKIPADELESYVAECIRDFQATIDEPMEPIEEWEREVDPKPEQPRT